MFWVPDAATSLGAPPRVVDDWVGFTGREESAGVRPGDPIFLSPEYRVDPLLTGYAQSRSFRRHTRETRRNYATDLRLFLTFLTNRSVCWSGATAKDVEDYEDWRRFAERNPRRIGGAKWDRELSSLMSLFRWATDNGHMQVNPIVVKQIVGRDGRPAVVPAARAKDAKRGNVHWLTPRTWRRWIGVGLCGHTAIGIPEPGWVGRLEDRNVAFVRVMVSSGLRRAEGGSLLTVDVPARQFETGRYCRGRVAAEVTRSKKSRTYYVAADAIADVETYCDSSRALTVRRAQKQGRYDRLPGRRMVTEFGGGANPTVVWRGNDGSGGERELDRFTVSERMTLFHDGPHGPEPMWLWLNERGLPFRIHSWEGVFTTANRRCATVLTPPERVGMDPHKVHAPYATPHSTRHSFALYMLVVLNTLMDQRFGLTPEERRDYRQLYGDPWFMVQNLLGHASRETTVERYLAPVADLQLRSMLADAASPPSAPMPELDELFTRIARESVGIQDIADFGASDSDT
ncbi:Tyrosine recombinase XerC [Mycolicibacterium vanbaalenii]|uniref:Tyrosine recombinase XerC n=1 Tax=Mycolicibacterium vanbaalenii TaxID=110539 RepID=A0A5S9QWV6_MYCVN|nr:Tyrosine recombinase XerC [Mycolicibacterium vanbaalenii]